MDRVLAPCVRLGITTLSRVFLGEFFRSCRMCGIVGLLVKNPALRNQLGALMVPMLVGMTERGPDSAGLAVYTTPVSKRHHKLSLYSGENAVDWSELLARMAADFAHAHAIAAHGNQAVLISAADPDQLAILLARNEPMIA